MHLVRRHFSLLGGRMMTYLDQTPGAHLIWNRLHQLIYLTAIAGVIHYYWLVKADVRKPLQYAAVLALLLGYRLAIWSVLKFNANRAARLPRPRVQVSEG